MMIERPLVKITSSNIDRVSWPGSPPVVARQTQKVEPKPQAWSMAEMQVLSARDEGLVHPTTSQPHWRARCHRLAGL
jgi:hypothetical protein